ncbi:hypothetical protein [Methylobacterium pseudosasicola]|uniref:Uncharacterized protein n=1 Tax=Methylobacterium pseudosasicola TaxID=582667 RepID=A0A1I4S593_9HYPH|nr:hypothetical protein [Methylobacterium pseudosasicola]SFM59667.1 hypothetical protein SAMN05192568_10409 [Methylobacterium pseudosasicola]
MATSDMINNVTLLVISILLSALPPIVFVGIRQAVKINRQEVVRDLAAVFTLPDSRNEGPIPSFEFVKYKYFFHRVGEDNDEEPRDHSLSSWLIGAVPLILLLFLLSYLAVMSIEPYVFDFVGKSLGASTNQKPSLDMEPTPMWVWSLCASLSGGYVFMIRSFYRAINNFDFSPMSLVGACNNLLVGIIGAQILTCVVLNPLANATMLHESVISAVLLFSFAIGYLPDSATRTILWRSDLGNFKRENRDIYKSSLTTPVEIIDGIDTETRDRLADYHIRSTQNLATANPLMLFVETPFGVYQIMDWVAQAQLCCSVGPEALVKLWRIGIRTLFDLERAALDDNCRDDQLLRKIGAILLPIQACPEQNIDYNANTKQSPEITSEIIANIVVRLDDPHVHRLRQIYIRIGNRIGSDSRRFPNTGRYSQGSNPASSDTSSAPA